MMSTKQMVLALLVSAQIASAAEGVVVDVPAAVEQVSRFSNLLKLTTEVKDAFVQAACNHKKAIAAVAVVSGVSAAAYYNWDRVQNAYNKAVAYVKENQEAIVANLKVGGVVLGATCVVAYAGNQIYNYFLGNNNNSEVAPVVADEAKADQEQVENAVEEPKAEEVAPAASEVETTKNGFDESIALAN